MFSLRSLFSVEYDSEVLQSLVEHMRRADWIKRAIVTPDPVEIEWSSKGRDRIAAIEQVMKICAPGLFDGHPKRIGVIAFLRMMWAIDIFTKDLKPPRLSFREERLLLIVVLGNARRKEAAKLEVPPEGRRGGFRL